MILLKAQWSRRKVHFVQVRSAVIPKDTDLDSSFYTTGQRLAGNPRSRPFHFQMQNLSWEAEFPKCKLERDILNREIGGI